MDIDIEQVRTRAYEIWDHEGRPEGRALDHWDAALKEFRTGVIDIPVSVPTMKAAVKGTKSRKRK
ncbi:MAG TPA: DUF2934 domain-containing protein [Methylovirgula sp.]|nr:DUF2934 domain-containing protein [Methylovirgula sp.]